MHAPTTPAAVPVDLLHYARNRPAGPIAMLALFAVGIALAWWIAVRGGQPMLVMGPPIFAALGNALYWRRVRQKHQVGCVTPCVVLSDQPWRWLAMTDLGYTDAAPPAPAVRVCDGSLAHHAGTLRPGDRFVAASMYEGEGVEHWEDFDPAPAGCATRDPEILARLMESIPEPTWRRLEQEAQRIEPGAAVGVRRIEDATPGP